MEFTQGQVFKMEKLSDYIKKTKDKKLSEEQTRQAIELFVSAKAEIDALRSGLDQLTDKEAIESGIYRLKAAELDLNRQIKMNKTTFLQS